MSVPTDGGAFLRKLNEVSFKLNETITAMLDIHLDDEDRDVISIMLLNMAAKHRLLK